MSEATATNTPRHIGIIMDGNGRWATMRGMRRTRGHREGIEAAKRVVLEAIDEGIEFLTLYAFSTENWRRAEEEVSFIMALLARNLRDQYDFYRDNNVRVKHMGDLKRLPREVQREIERVTEETAENTAITVTLAVNYGGRDEVVRAVNRWVESQRREEARQSDGTGGPEERGYDDGPEAAHDAQRPDGAGGRNKGASNGNHAGSRNERSVHPGPPQASFQGQQAHLHGRQPSLHEDDIHAHMDLPEVPDPDLIIRTGGEQRLSNFLLWESAYAELYFTGRLWPEFDGEDLREAIEDFRGRKRNFGGMPVAAVAG